MVILNWSMTNVLGIIFFFTQPFGTMFGGYLYIYIFYDTYHKLKGKGTKSYLKLLFLVRELLKFCHACRWFYHTLLNLRLSWLFLRWTTLAINSHALTKRGLTAGRGILWSLFRYNITRSFKHNAYRIFTLRNTGLIEIEIFWISIGIIEYKKSYKINLIIKPIGIKLFWKH